MAKRTTEIKTKEQIRVLRKAALITIDIFNEVKKYIKPGVSEKQVRDILEEKIKQRGLKRSFITIAAAGENAANPHAVVSGRKIKKNDVFVLDFGVIYYGLHSDFTRTVLIGQSNPKIQSIYNAVNNAVKISISSIKEGIKISDHVKKVHDYLRNKGFGKYIKHTLGHGLGTKIHEAPKLSERNKRKLKENMVVTIEPGLYIEGLGGVRIEEMVLIKKKGCEVLTK